MTFDEYKDGDWVIYNKPGHEWHMMSFQAYKSKYTADAFRLKYGSRELVADISEVLPQSAVNQMMKNAYGDTYENSNRNFQSDARLTNFKEGHVDSDADASGIFDIQD